VIGKNTYVLAIMGNKCCATVKMVLQAFVRLWRSGRDIEVLARTHLMFGVTHLMFGQLGAGSGGGRSVESVYFVFATLQIEAV